MIAMEYGREKIVKPDWKQIFDQKELDIVIARMLKLTPSAPPVTTKAARGRLLG